MRVDLWSGLDRGHEAALAPLAWYEGLQLQPQHFQQWDARLDGILHRQMMATHPFAWGIDRLMVDTAALMAGVLRLHGAAGQFPDGLAFAWDPSMGQPLEERVVLSEEENAAVYALAIPRCDFTDNGARVERFRQHVGAPVADLADPDEKVVVARWIPQLSLRRWDPAQAHYVQLPIVKVLRAATGFQLGEFHPPAVRLVAESACARDILDLVRLLRSKAGRVDAGALPAVLDRQYQGGLTSVLMALTAALPRLEAELASGVAHPYSVHLSLCDMAGAVAALTGRVPELFTAYQHADPAASLGQVIRYIARIVATVCVDKKAWNEVPFAQDNGRWTCEMQPMTADHHLVVRVDFAATWSDPAIGTWLEHTLICVDVDEQRSREYRVRGLSRRSHAAMPALGLVGASARRYVEIDLPSSIPQGARLVVSGADERSQAGVVSMAWMVRG